MKALLILHIAGGSLGIITGFTSLFAPKGSTLHRQSGLVFVASMVMLGLTASIIGLAKNQPGNVSAGLIATYMVVTGLGTVRPIPRNIDIGAMLFAGLAGSFTLASGILLAFQGKMFSGGVPIPMILFLGTVIVSAAYGDLRTLQAGTLRGSKRIVRHLWRMCFSLFIASGSFFSIRKRVAVILPDPLLGWSVRLIPILLPLFAIFYWLWKIKVRKTVNGLRTRSVVNA